MNSRSKPRNGRSAQIPMAPAGVKKITDALLEHVRGELSQQFFQTQAQLRALEHRVMQSTAQGALNRYREDARDMALFMLSSGELSESDVIEQAYDFADAMEMEFEARMAARKAKVDEERAQIEAAKQAAREAAEAAAAAEAEQPEGGDGELSAAIGKLIENREEGHVGTAQEAGEAQDGSQEDAG